MQAERLARALKRDEKRKMRLKAAKIDYDYTPLSRVLTKEKSSSQKPEPVKKPKGKKKSDTASKKKVKS